MRSNLRLGKSSGKKSHLITKLFRVWHPPRNHDSLSQQQDIIIDEDGTPLNSGLQTPQRRRLPELLDTLTRDKIFKLVLDIGPSNRKISKFPSATFLAKIMDIFFVQEAESLESRIQPAVFSVHSVRPELLLAMIATGCINVNNEPIRKMGRAFHEIVRLSLVEMVRTRVYLQS